MIAVLRELVFDVEMAFEIEETEENMIYYDARIFNIPTRPRFKRSRLEFIETTHCTIKEGITNPTHLKVLYRESNICSAFIDTLPFAGDLLKQLLVRTFNA